MYFLAFPLSVQLCLGNAAMGVAKMLLNETGNGKHEY